MRLIKKISIEVESNLIFFNVPKANDIVNRTCYIELEYLPNHLNNVSSTNSKQSKLCVKCTLYIDTRLLGKHAVRLNRPQYVYDEIVKASVS